MKKYRVFLKNGKELSVNASTWRLDGLWVRFDDEEASGVAIFHVEDLIGWGLPESIGTV